MTWTILFFTLVYIICKFSHLDRLLQGRSLGLEVMGGDSCSKGREFEYQHHILDGHFLAYLFVVKFVMCV